MIYQLLPLLIAIAIALCVAKIFSHHRNNDFDFYNVKVLVACMIIAGIGSFGCINQGALTLVMNFALSFLCWYLLITLCRIIVKKFQK